MSKDLSKIFSLEGRVALVTGGSRGLGRWIAEGFVAQGARVYISSRKASACEAAAAEIGDGCTAIAHDISTVDGCKALAEDFAGHESHLDILVNNAGATWGAPFETFPEAGWDKVMGLNVRSPFFLTQALYPMLCEGARLAGPAKVIMLSSIDGLRTSEWETYSYQASKAAIEFLTRRLAARLIKDGINVTAIAPGAFPSDMNRSARDMADAVASLIPAGRVGRSTDVIAAAVYLASRAGDYVVGDSITVDGGLVHAMAARQLDP